MKPLSAPCGYFPNPLQNDDVPTSVVTIVDAPSVIYGVALPPTKSKAVAAGVLPSAPALASRCPRGKALRLGSPE